MDGAFFWIENWFCYSVMLQFSNLRFIKLRNGGEKNLNKKTLATLLALGVITAGGYFGVKSVKADETFPHSDVVQKIAEKFSLNESDVQAVFDSVHEEHMQQMQTSREERLNQAVSDGVLTEDQKNALIQKMEEHIGERQQNREEMQAWFNEQGIDETKLHEYLGFGGHGPRGDM